jgi:hypothetical protein
VTASTARHCVPASSSGRPCLRRAVLVAVDAPRRRTPRRCLQAARSGFFVTGPCTQAGSACRAAAIYNASRSSSTAGYRFRCTMDVGDRERLLISSQLRTNHTTTRSPACARRCALFPLDAVARPRVTLKVLSCSHVDGRTQAPHAMRRPARQRARRLRGVRAASAAKLRTRQCRGHAAALAAYLGPISGRAPATGLRRRYLDEMGLMVNGTLLREAAGKTGSSGSSASGGRGNVAGNARRRTAEARTGPGPAP